MTVSAEEARRLLSRTAGRAAEDGDQACQTRLSDGDLCGARATHRCLLCRDYACERHARLHDSARAFRWG